MSLPLAQGPEGQPQESVLTPEVKAKLDDLVKGNDLVLIMKGTPDAPQCGFSQRAAEVYTALGKKFTTVNVFEHPDPMLFIRQINEWSDWPTLPQCWVKGELIGGSDIALEMYQNGELQEMLEEDAA